MKQTQARMADFSLCLTMCRTTAECMIERSEL